MSRAVSPGWWERNSGEPTGHGHRWVWRVLYILYSLEVGVFLLFLPWLAIWENNYLLYRFPHLQPIVTNAFLKGAVLGLGIVNIFIGVYEIGFFKRKSRKPVGVPM
jgi:hypothetical protein